MGEYSGSQYLFGSNRHRNKVQTTPFLSIFLAVDVIFVFKIVLSALAILFAYNTISGEREDGTPETGAIQSDSEGHSHIWQIPWGHVVSVSNRCDEFRGRTR